MIIFSTSSTVKYCLHSEGPKDMLADWGSTLTSRTQPASCAWRAQRADAAFLFILWQVNFYAAWNLGYPRFSGLLPTQRSVWGSNLWFLSTFGSSLINFSNSRKRQLKRRLDWFGRACASSPYTCQNSCDLTKSLLRNVFSIIFLVTILTLIHTASLLLTTLTMKKVITRSSQSWVSCGLDSHNMAYKWLNNHQRINLYSYTASTLLQFCCCNSLLSSICTSSSSFPHA